MSSVNSVTPGPLFVETKLENLVPSIKEGRVWVVLKSICFPIAWLIEKIINFVKELFSSDGRIDEDLKGESDEVNDVIEYAKRQFTQFDYLKDKYNSTIEKIEAIKNKSDSDNTPTKRQFFDRINEIDAHVNFCRTSRDDLEGDLKTLNAKKADLKDSNPSKSDMALVEDAQMKVAARVDALKKEADSITAEWEHLLKTNQKGIIAHFLKFQSLLPKKLEEDLKKEKDSSADSEKDTLARSYNLFKCYMTSFYAFKKMGWIKDDGNHEAVFKFGKSFALLSGLPNFENKLSNVCWMNSSIAAIKAVPKLMSKLNENFSLPKDQANLKDAFKKLLGAQAVCNKEKIGIYQNKIIDCLHAIKGGKRLGVNQEDPSIDIIPQLLESLNFSVPIIQTLKSDKKETVNLDAKMLWSVSLPGDKSKAKVKYVDLLKGDLVEEVDDPGRKWDGNIKYTITNQFDNVPDVLAIHLKRYKKDEIANDDNDDENEDSPKSKFQASKINTSLQIDDVMDLTKANIFTDHALNGKTAKYKLISCVLHSSKKTIASGHYTAIAFDGDICREYNDDRDVTRISKQKGLKLASKSVIQFWQRI